MRKKSIITKGLIASSMLYANVHAANPLIKDVFINNKVESVARYNTTEVNNGFSQMYQWHIETESGIFSGICKTIDEVNKEIIQSCKNEKIITKNITPSYLNENEIGDKIFTWSVVTKKGNASGQSGTLEEAQSSVKLFEPKEVVESNIIELKTILK